MKMTHQRYLQKVIWYSFITIKSIVFFVCFRKKTILITLLFYARAIFYFWLGWVFVAVDRLL